MRGGIIFNTLKSVTEKLLWGYWACDSPCVSSGNTFRFFLNAEENGRKKKLELLGVLFFSLPVKDEKLHAVKKKKKCFLLFCLFLSGRRS